MKNTGKASKVLVFVLLSILALTTLVPILYMCEVTLLTKEEYLSYREDYARQETALSSQLAQLEQEDPEDVLERPWITALLKHGKLTQLDRTTVAETVKDILIFEDGHIEITYLFSDELGILTAPDGRC